MAELRADAARLASTLNDSNTRFVAVWKSRCLVHGNAAALLKRAELGETWQPETGIYLGQLDAQHIFAVELPDELGDNGPGEVAFENFRGILGDLPEDDAALLAYAKGMVEWHGRHRYCGVCGLPNLSLEGGFVLECASPKCGHRSFPRLDPAIIVLTIDGDKCLLGRQVRWPEGRYSTIAGFVEPGESLEDSVRREVKEETDIDVGKVHYMGSQPWPFPTAVMIGFHAEAVSKLIHRTDGELADAGWFTREEIAAGNIVLPPITSIAFRLIEHWFDGWDGPRLAELNLSGDFSRRTGERT
ncbi:MAG: NAD(+) diphosphatase [Gammaproteobacteria bacterium]|jgi:NAD+ diphosphatase|nr:NAD(+) diphosphatase [Gammaproteobacteria bacterium]